LHLPDVTVVITTRDRPGLVVRAVDSALAQTMQAIEVVVVDDG
jgi:glycosyltransferase involved in cell wall biosynthesis